MSLAAWFVPVPASQRDDALAAYAAHLARRDGNPDVPTRTLSQREATLLRLAREQRCFAGRIDPECFAAHMRTVPRQRPATMPAVPADLQFVCTCIRANTYEEYAVNKLLRTVVYTQHDTMQQRTNVIIMLEECYHTRFLLSIAELFALPVLPPAPPPFVVRTLIASLASLPTLLAHPLTLCSEILSLALFVKLLELAGSIFATEPALRQAIAVRLGEVIADELGHISYNRLHLSPAGLAMAQRLRQRAAQNR